MLMLWVSLPASAFEVDGIAYQIESDNEVSVTSKSERYSGSISIPSSVTYKDKIYNVTSIGLQAFMNSINLSAITIPATVSQIGKAAFASCKNLIYISLPDLIQSIPDQCFFECSNLENIRLPQHLISIKEHAFAFCKALRTIDLPNSVQEIGKAAFSQCNTLRTMDLPNSLQEVGERAFYGCELLNDISIPASITNIPAECFQGCINLTNVELHNGIKKVGHHAFCTRDYIYLHLPPSVEYIDQYIIDYGGIVLYRGNVMLDQQSGIDIAVLDSAFPTIIEKGDAHLFLVNPESFLSSNNYSSSKVSSIGEYGDNESEKIFWYDGTPQALRKGLFDNAELQEMGIEWYCKDFDVKDVGNYSGNAVVEVKHNDWSNTFPVSYAFEILKAQLIVRVNDCEKIYGDENPLFTFETNGLVENDNVDNSILNPIFSTSATNDSEVGNYSIDFSAESNNYNIKVVQGNLKVKQAPLIVQLDNFSRQYGDNNPEFLMSFEGLKLNDTGNNVFSTQPVLSCKATTTSDVGEYPIVASGGVSKNYEITAYKSGVLSVTKAPLTLKAKDASRIYGDENPEFDFSLSGLKNSDDISCISTKPTYTCLSTTTSDCGEYDIVPSNAQAKNYEISYLKGTLTVTQAPLILVASNLSREYGDSNPIFVYEAVGLKGNDTAETGIMEEPILSTTANEYSGVGQYPISVTGGLAKNYSLSYRSGVLTVTKAPLSVIAENAEREYGESNPAFSRSYSGLKLNDTEATAFSSVPVLSCNATVTSDVGEYPIVATGGASKNYEITAYKSGVLSVTKAPITLKAKDASRIYGDENPEFDFSLSGLKNSDDISCISTKPTYTCLSTTTSDCGEYDIVPSNAQAKNYEISYLKGTLTVTQAPLILVASNLSREYGDSNPIFVYEAVGLKGNDTAETAIMEDPILSTTASENSGVGQYPITVTGGNAKNYSLSYRSGVLTVTKAPLTVIAENSEREYGESNPAFSRSYSGLKLNDSEATVFSSLPALSCTATKSSDVGEYPIIVNGGISKNYEIVSYEKGVLKVKKAPLTLTAIDKSRLYFEDNPRFDYKLTGLRNSDSKNCLSTQPSFKCSAIKTSNVGDYEIMPADALAKNYAIDYKAGILSINKRALTAGIGNYTKIYGTENPKFEIEYSGFVNNEDKSVITNIPDVVCPANQSSDVGSYPISLEGGDAQNYVINKYNSGTLVINKADQILKWEQDLSDIPMNSQIALEASSDSGLPVSYEMSPNNVATLYNNNGIWYLDCYGSGAVNIRAVQNGDKNHNAASMISKTLVVNGSGGDPSNPQIFLNVENAGALSSLIATNRKYQIKNLRLTGYLNGADINFIREMAGSDSYGNGTPGVLETLDISGCSIVSGGISYYKSCRTSNNRVSDYMFYNCKQLVNLMLPDNTSIIDDYAFADCDRLSVISIPNEVTSFGLQSFRNDISLLRIPMPKGLKSIKDYAFIGCNGITELTIPAKVTQIGDGIVRDCQNISKINVAEGNDNFASQNGVLYSSNYNELLIFPVNYESDSYSVIDGTKRIAPYAFVNSKKLSKVILPATLTSIGTDAFIGCVNLTSLQVQAITPPVCDNDCFEAVSKTRCELIVPKGCYSYYWVAPVWSDFNKIREVDNSGIDDALPNKIEVITESRHIVVKGVPENTQVSVFHTDGTLVYQAQSYGGVIHYYPETSGIYLIVIGNKPYKLMVQ